RLHVSTAQLTMLLDICNENFAYGGFYPVAAQEAPSYVQAQSLPQFVTDAMPSRFQGDEDPGSPSSPSRSRSRSSVSSACSSSASQNVKESMFMNLRMQFESLSLTLHQECPARSTTVPVLQLSTGNM
ncbi:unnamed protein product, partial [Prorocentrum cordatum]